MLFGEGVSLLGISIGKEFVGCVKVLEFSRSSSTTLVCAIDVTVKVCRISGLVSNVIADLSVS